MVHHFLPFLCKVTYSNKRLVYSDVVFCKDFSQIFARDDATTHKLLICIHREKTKSGGRKYDAPFIIVFFLLIAYGNRILSYSEKESESNDVLIHFVEFSNVHNSDRSSNATRSNYVYKNYKHIAQSRVFCRIAKWSIQSA